eukprot:162924-Hanusia_phi.AAC.1
MGWRASNYKTSRRVSTSEVRTTLASSQPFPSSHSSDNSSILGGSLTLCSMHLLACGESGERAEEANTSAGSTARAREEGEGRKEEERDRRGKVERGNGGGEKGEGEKGEGEKGAGDENLEQGAIVDESADVVGEELEGLAEELLRCIDIMKDSIPTRAQEAKEKRLTGGSEDGMGEEER